MDPIRYVLLLRFLRETYDGERIVDLLESALEMEHVCRVPAEDVRLESNERRKSILCQWPTSQNPKDKTKRKSEKTHITNKHIRQTPHKRILLLIPLPKPITKRHMPIQNPALQHFQALPQVLRQEMRCETRASTRCGCGPPRAGVLRERHGRMV